MWLLATLSLPHLRRHAARTTLSVFGIVLGIAAMVATTAATDAVVEAFQRSLHATAGRTQLQVANGGAGVPEALVQELAALPDVAAVAPVVQGFVSLGGDDGDMLAVFGIPLLEDTEREVQLPRAALDVPDGFELVARLDSVVVARSFAAKRGLAIGSPLAVVGPRGRTTLTVRGLVDDVGPAALFDGMAALMDLPAAQRLLAREGLVDRIDVRVADGRSPRVVAKALAPRVGGRGHVSDNETHGTTSDELAFSARAMLAIAGLVSVVVGFLLIYHTVSVSLVQRRREIALLDALGVGTPAIVAWLVAEAVAVGTLAGVGGYGLGILLARAAIGSVGTVATAFARVPSPEIAVSTAGLLLAIGLGVLVAVVATLVPAYAILRLPPARFLNFAAPPPPSRPWRAMLGAAVAFAVVVVLLRLAPASLGYRPVVAWVFAVNSLTLVAFALACPLAAVVVARVAARVAARAGGPGLLLASGAVAREPAGAAGVLVALVLGLGWTLADASLIASFRASWLGWIDHHYRSDLVLTAGPSTVSFLSAPPIADDVVTELRAVPGVRAVQGVRITHVEREGKAFAVQAFDRGPDPLPVLGDWPSIADAFWTGRGVLVNQQLADRAGLRAGGTFALPTPGGTRTFPILGVFTDFRVGYLGSVALARPLYTTLWPDRAVNAIHVWADGPAAVEPVRREVQRRFAASHGIRAATVGQFRSAVVGLTEHIFALHYTLVVIALVVAVAGVANFLLARSLDRGPEYRVLEAAGVGDRDIGVAVVAEGALLGVVGASIGLVAGFVVSLIIVHHSVPMVNGWHFDFRFPVATAVRLAGAAVLLSAVAGVVPAAAALRSLGARPAVAE